MIYGVTGGAPDKHFLIILNEVSTYGLFISENEIFHPPMTIQIVIFASQPLSSTIPNYLLCHNTQLLTQTSHQVLLKGLSDHPMVLGGGDGHFSESEKCLSPPMPRSTKRKLAAF